ncbi:hypothetical protein ACO0R3_000893 [Hanseniaspora guilliermondii]
MSSEDISNQPEGRVKRTRTRQQQVKKYDLLSESDDFSNESEIEPKPKRKKTPARKSTSPKKLSKKLQKTDENKEIDSDSSFMFTSDGGIDNAQSEATETPIFNEIDTDDVQYEIKQSKINFDLTEEDVNENFFDTKIVGNSTGLTDEETGFFIEYVEKYMSVKKMKGSNVLQQKNLVKHGGSTIKQRSTVHESKVDNLLPLPTEMTNYAQQKFEGLKRSLENMDKDSLMMNYNPTMSFFRSRNVTKSTGKGKDSTEESLKEMFTMPITLDNETFNKIEEEIITNDLEPFLESKMIPNFRKQYIHFTMELLAGKSICFYGLGNKKDVVLNFCDYFISKMNNEVYKRQRVELCVIDGLTVPSRYNSLYANVKAFLGVDPLQLIAFEKTLHKEKKQLWGDHALRELDIFVKFYNFCKNSNDLALQRLADIKLVLLIHNADSEMFRKPSYKKFLSALAKVPVIKIVITVDGIKYPVNMEKSLRDDLNLAMHPLTTLKPYDVEGVINRNDRDRFYALFDSLFGNANGSNGPKRNTKLIKGPSVYDSKSGLTNIFASISKKNLKIFKLLMETILERKRALNNKQSKSYRIPFRDFLSTCQQHLLASNEMTLRTALIEFTTHSLCILADKKRLGYDLLDTTYSEMEIEHMLENQLKDI